MIDYDDKYMHRNIQELLVFFYLIFSNIKMLISDYHLYYMFYKCLEKMVFERAVVIVYSFCSSLFDFDGAMAKWLTCWIPNLWVPFSK